MRQGVNPARDYKYEKSLLTHQIIIPVYIPNQEEYFKDAYKILQICLESLFKTVHQKTFVTIVNNGSNSQVVSYLNKLFAENKIHEVIHISNIGKTNAIIKGLSSHKFELVTIADADVLFLNNWQDETVKVFNAFPKAGVVGLVPQFKLFAYLSDNLLFDKLFSKKLKFTTVKNPEAMKCFYKSIEWDDNYNKDYLKKYLTFNSKSNIKAVVGSGHFVATYRKQIFEVLPKHEIKYKLDPKSDRGFLDIPLLKLGGWRLTTENNYAYHMGNVYEDWMTNTLNTLKDESDRVILKCNKIILKSSWISYFIKNHLFRKLLESKKMMRFFIKFKGLPKTMVKKF